MVPDMQHINKISSLCFRPKPQQRPCADTSHEPACMAYLHAFGTTSSDKCCATWLGVATRITFPSCIGILPFCVLHAIIPIPSSRYQWRWAFQCFIILFQYCINLQLTCSEYEPHKQRTPPCSSVSTPENAVPKSWSSLTTSSWTARNLTRTDAEVVID